MQDYGRSADASASQKTPHLQSIADARCLDEGRAWTGRREVCLEDGESGNGLAHDRVRRPLAHASCEVRVCLHSVLNTHVELLFGGKVARHDDV